MKKWGRSVRSEEVESVIHEELNAGLSRGEIKYSFSVFLFDGWDTGQYTMCCWNPPLRYLGKLDCGCLKYKCLWLKPKLLLYNFDANMSREQKRKSRHGREDNAFSCAILWVSDACVTSSGNGVDSWIWHTGKNTNTTDFLFSLFLSLGHKEIMRGRNTARTQTEHSKRLLYALSWDFYRSFIFSLLC